MPHKTHALGHIQTTPQLRNAWAKGIDDVLPRNALVLRPYLPAEFGYKLASRQPFLRFEPTVCQWLLAGSSQMTRVTQGQQRASGKGEDRRASIWPIQRERHVDSGQPTANQQHRFIGTYLAQYECRPRISHEA